MMPHLRGTNLSNNLEADVVIIGAGSAGAVVAARLSEDPGIHVVLLEAGTQDSSWLNDTPAMTLKLIGNPKTDWDYRTEPDPTANSRVSVWAGGKMLGGGSSINGLVYIRGLQRDYNDWARLGCTGWGWNDVEPFFRKAEGYTDDGHEAMGRNGPYAVSRIRSVHPLTNKFVEACAQIGLPTLDNYNAGNGEGAYVNLTSQRLGRRSSTASTYLKLASGRKNLRVVKGALVDKVLFNNQRACGVRARIGNDWVTISARREVVVSAGTIQSPAILLRSGIGPGEQLQAQGIAMQVNARDVGRNLQEHVGVGKLKFVNQPTYNSEMDPLNGMRHLLNYLVNRRGPLASAAVQGMAWLRTDDSLSEPDVHLNFFPLGIDYSMSPPTMFKQPTITLSGCISRPHSRGEIRLRSTNPDDKPVIDFQMYQDSRDVTTAVGLLKKVDQIFAAPALAKTVIGSVPPFDHDMAAEELETMVRACSGPGYHCIGTCRLGTDEHSVVDTELRVRGVHGLRVVDASVMPMLVSANTNSAAIMVGERGAEFIKPSLR